MIEILNDPYVKAMVELSSERERSKEEWDKLSSKVKSLDNEKFFALCKEHELDGVVASRLKSAGISMD